MALKTCSMPHLSNVASSEPPLKIQHSAPRKFEGLFFAPRQALDVHLRIDLACNSLQTACNECKAHGSYKRNEFNDSALKLIENVPRISKPTR